MTRSLLLILLVTSATVVVRADDTLFTDHTDPHADQRLPSSADTAAGFIIDEVEDTADDDDGAWEGHFPDDHPDATASRSDRKRMVEALRERVYPAGEEKNAQVPFREDTQKIFAASMD